MTSRVSTCLRASQSECPHIFQFVKLYTNFFESLLCIIYAISIGIIHAIRVDIFSDLIIFRSLPYHMHALQEKSHMPQCIARNSEWLEEATAILVTFGFLWWIERQVTSRQSTFVSLTCSLLFTALAKRNIKQRFRTEERNQLSWAINLDGDCCCSCGTREFDDNTYITHILFCFSCWSILLLQLMCLLHWRQKVFAHALWSEGSSGCARHFPFGDSGAPLGMEEALAA